MSDQQVFAQKQGRGRPRGNVKPATIALRLPVDVLHSVDVWIAAQPEPRPTRSEAITRLLAEVLGKQANAGTIAAEDLNASNDE